MKCKYYFLLGLLSLLGLAPWSYAQLEDYRAYRFFDLSGGLNDTAESTQVAANEASRLQNFIFSTSGSIERREGFTQINSSAIGATAVFTGLAYYKQSDGDRFLVGTVSNGASDAIYKMDYTGTSTPDGTWDNITGSTTLVLVDDTLADFATVQDVLIIEDGYGLSPPQVWNGTGDITSLRDSDADVPNASMVEFHKRILWSAGDDAAKSEVSFSNLDAYATWIATDTILVETDDGQTITGLKSALDCLYVFKSESIWRICGADRDNLYLEQMVKGIGAASNQSIALINNQFIFVTSQGNIVVYDGGITVQTLSSKINGTLRSLNPSRFRKVVATAFDDGTGDEDYYACVSLEGAGTHTRVLFYDTLHKAWSVLAGISCNAMAVMEVNTSQKALVFGDYAGRANRYPDGDTDAGSTIIAFFQSGDNQFGDIPQEKTFRDLQLFARDEGNDRVAGFRFQVDFGGEVTTSGTADLAGAGAVWDTAIYDTDTYADGSTVIRRFPVDRVGDFLNWRVEQNDGLSPILVRGVQAWVQAGGRLGELGDIE